MTHVLRFGRTRAIPLSDRQSVSVGSARRTAIASAVLEIISAGALLLFVHQLNNDDIFALAVGLTCAFLVVGRMAVGFARAELVGAVAFGLLTLLQLLVLASAMDDRQDLRLAATLVALGVIPAVAATMPAIALRGVDEGLRDDVTPSLLASALGGGLGILVSIALASVVDVGDARLGELMPYFAVAMALVGMAEVLGHHRIGAGFPGTVVAVTAVAVALGGLLLVNQPAAVVDNAVTASGVSSGVAAMGLLLATALATPRAFVVPVEEVRDGPRLVGWLLVALVAVATVARLVGTHPLWLDEAEIARLTDGSLRDTLDAARSAHAHPPLFDVLVWVSRQIFGASDTALRLPSILAGVLLVPAVYVTAEKLYDRRVGALAAAVAAVGPGFLWLSGAAEPGALAALLATLSLLTYLMAIDRGRMTDWFLFAAAATALLWTHQLGFVHVALLHLAAAATLWQRRQTGDRLKPFAMGWGAALALTAAAFVALLSYRDGIGRSDVLPPFEYATRGAPGAGRSVFGLVGTALNGLFGFHPSDVTSRLLALWPLCILATFVFFCRSWSRRGALLVALALAPFAVLLTLQVAGVPRNPPFALSWVSTALPMIAIGAGRAMSLSGRWSTSRAVGLLAICVLLIATADQLTRVKPVDRFDIEPALEQLRSAQAGDIVVYAPDSLGDLVRHEAHDATVITTSDVSMTALAAAPHVFVFGAFAFNDDASLDRVLALVRDLAAGRQLASESQLHEAKVWIFN